MYNRIIKNIFFGLTIGLWMFQSGCLNQKSSTNIQSITRDVLAENVLQASADSGLVIIMDVESGKIIADVSVANKDSSIIKVSKRGNHLKNEGFGGLVQPFALMAALESGNITMEDSVDTERGLVIYNGQHILDSNYAYGGYGKIELSNVLRLNSDIGVFRSLTKAFDSHPDEYFYELNKIASALPYKPAKWTGNSPTQFLPDLDYGIQLNQIQLLILYNAIANNGEMVFEGKVLDPSIVSPTTISNIRKALKEVVSPEGTGKLAISDQVSIAGKTGTYIDTTKQMGTIGPKTFSFCGYFPTENPQFTCLVLVYSNKENLTNNRTVVVRILKEIAEKILVNLR